MSAFCQTYWGYFLPPRHYLKGERKEDGRVQP